MGYHLIDGAAFKLRRHFDTILRNIGRAKPK
jgi:hypothetical protein